MSTRAKWLCALLALAWLPGQAQDFPSRPLRIVVPQSVGSTWDARVRLIAEHLSRGLGQPVQVENRPGASGTIAAAQVAKAPADGYIILAGTSADQSVAPATMDLPYDARRSFTPVTAAVRAYAVLVAHPGLGVSDARQMLALARTRSVTMGTYGPGSLTQLIALQLKEISGADIVTVPYPSTRDALSDVLAGRIDLLLDFVPSIGPYVRSGRLRGLMVVGAARLPALPEVPSAAELGMPEVRHPSWGGFLVPAGTPAPVVRRLNAALASALGSPRVVEDAQRESVELVADSPEEFAAFIRAQQEAFARLAQATGARRGL